MPKGIKKRAKIILIVAASLVILLASPIILLNISGVQRFVVNKVTNVLEQKLETHIEIGKVKYKLFNKLSLSEVLIEDQHSDTLLYANEVSASVSILPLFKRELRLNEGILSGVDMHIITYADGSNNIAFIAQAFKSTKQSDPFSFDLETITLSDTRLRYLDLRGDTTLQSGLFNSKNIAIKDLGLHVRFNKDSEEMSGSLSELHFKERSGFELNNLSTEFLLCDSLFQIDEFIVRTPKSYLEIQNVWLSFDSLKNLEAQLPNMGLNALILPSYLYLPDFSCFIPALANFPEQATLQGKIWGRVDNLKLNELIAIMGNGLSVNGDLEINGLPNLKNALLFGSINSITFNKHAIQDVVANFSKRPFILPNELNNLGECNYSGKITGFLDNLVLYGKLVTDIGTLVTDVSIESEHHFSDFRIKGDLRSSVLRLGRLFPKSGVGNASFKISTVFEAGKNIPLSTKATIDLTSITFREYTYRDIVLKGEYSGKEFIGKVLLDDKNGYFDFEGQINLSKEDRAFKFDAIIEDLNLYNLNLDTRYPDLFISADIFSNFEGDKIENMVGRIEIENLILSNSDAIFKLDTFALVADEGENYHVTLNSDIINGRLQGDYALSSIAAGARNLLVRYLPVLVGEKMVAQNRKGNSLEFALEIDPLRDLCDVLEIPWYTTENSTIYGFYDDNREIFNFEVSIPILTNGKRSIDGIYLFCNNTQDLSLQLRASTKLKRDTLYAQLDIDANRDTITTLLQWDNHNSESLLAGEFLSHTHLFRVNDSLEADIRIEHTEFAFRNKPWIIQNSEILTNFKWFDVRHLQIFSKDQNIAINGIVSDNASDSLVIDLLNINLDYISEIIPNMSQLHFGGDVTGYASIASVLKEPQITANVTAKNFAFNNSYLGNAYVNSHFDLENKSIVFMGDVLNDESDTTAIITGNYFVGKDSLDIIGKADSLSLGFLNYYLGDIFDTIIGYGTGDVHIYGITKSKNIAIDADAYIADAKLKVAFLQTTYSFSDTLHMDKDGIRFNNIELTDNEGNKGLLNGDISFDYLKDMRFNIDIYPNKMLVLNTTKQDLSNFYGKAYASGLVGIKGTDKDIKISCRATTEPGTRIFIPIDSYYASDNSFITFVNPADSLKPKRTTEEEELPKKTNMFIDMMLDVNTNAEIQLLIDSKAGDMIKGTGNGNLKITFDMLSSAFKMYGTYTIDKGEYLFTFQNVLRKYFHVKDGSTLTWSGDPLEPLIDINAYYQLSASLIDILDDATLSNAARSSVAVQCILNLSGNLMQPTIKFDINLPNSDEDLNRALKNAISTDEQMNRQIIGLLLLGKFINPDSYQSAATFLSGNELFSVVSSTLSSQLNSWASQLFENWNFGVNFRTSGEGDTRSNEYELNFLYTPNDRIVINGNVGYRDDNLSSSKFIGDFDFEYKLNRSGKLRAKAYTHTNDYKEFKKGLTTQGVGLVYRESFNSLPQLWQSWKDAIKTSKQERADKRAERRRKKEARKLKKEEEAIKREENNSII